MKKIEAGRVERTILTDPLIQRHHLERPAIVYMRQSSMAQVTENWGSTAIQRELVELALAYGWRRDQVITIDEDLGKSGATTVGRTGFERVVSLIITGTIGGLIALNASRLAREVIAFERLRIAAKFHATVLIIDRKVYNPADPTDTAHAQVRAVFSELENVERAKHLRLSKLAKARAGELMCQLPIGWLPNAGGSFDFDLAVKAAIEEVYEVFRRVRTARGTAGELQRRGQKLPSRHRGATRWRRPETNMVREFLTNPAYAGWYLFGKSDSRPEYGLLSSGKVRRRMLPESEWIRHRNHHPAYITEEEQDLFLRILKGNRFENRNRPARGPTMCQGIAECGQCGNRLSVLPARRGSIRYQCTTRSVRFVEPGCFSVQADKVDQAVERAFLTRLGNPIADILDEAFRELRSTHNARFDRRESERQRLVADEERARRRYDLVQDRGGNPRVLRDREDQLERAIAAREDFDRRVAMESDIPPTMPEAAELARLQVEISSVAELWSSAVVTNREKKEMLRCLISRVIVDRTDTHIHLTICWRDGTQSELSSRRLGGIRELVGQLHAEGLSAREIRDRLAEGDPDTGESWHYTKEHIYQILQQLGLKPNRPQRRSVEGAREHIHRLYSAGQTIASIVAELNTTGILTATGQTWTPSSVNYWIRQFAQTRRFDELHMAVFADARRRGLTAAQTAEELNLSKVPRIGGQPWTAQAVRLRRAFLARRERRKKLEQER